MEIAYSPVNVRLLQANLVHLVRDQLYICPVEFMCSSRKFYWATSILFSQVYVRWNSCNSHKTYLKTKSYKSHVNDQSAQKTKWPPSLHTWSNINLSTSLICAGGSKTSVYTWYGVMNRCESLTTHTNSLIISWEGCCSLSAWRSIFNSSKCIH